MPDRVYPRLEVFERLHISDGLAINAERWRQAHAYHRQRQNFHYQALYEPGIVYGLGVAVMPQPDGRLVQIQPGVAIDVVGNPIIVKQPEEFRISSEPSEGQSLLVHLVVNYVDPDDLRRVSNGKTAQETFRIVEKLHLDANDVEICRIELQAGATLIQPPTNVFTPQPNQLDFRSRCYPRPYPQLHIQVGLVTGDGATDRITLNGLMDLLRSLESLYPSLRAAPTVQTVSAQALGRESMTQCQLLVAPYRALSALSTAACQRLQMFLAQGGVLLVVADFAETNLLDLLNIERELQAGLVEAERDRDLLNQTEQLRAEIAANQAAVAQHLSELEQAIAPIAARLGVSLSESGELHQDHPLCCRPFTFSQLPQRLEHPIRVKNWGGLVLMVGNLTYCWGQSATPAIAREVLRSAQEWGINLLHFAAQRQHWTQAMQSQTTPNNGATDSLQRRIKPSTP